MYGDFLQISTSKKLLRKLSKGETIFFIKQGVKVFNPVTRGLWLPNMMRQKTVEQIAICDL